MKRNEIHFVEIPELLRWPKLESYVTLFKNNFDKKIYENINKVIRWQQWPISKQLQIFNRLPSFLKHLLHSTIGKIPYKCIFLEKLQTDFRTF